MGRNFWPTVPFDIFSRHILIPYYYIVIPFETSTDLNQLSYYLIIRLFLKYSSSVVEERTTFWSRIFRAEKWNSHLERLTIWLLSGSGIATSSNRDSRLYRRFILIYTWSWCRLPRNWIIALRIGRAHSLPTASESRLVAILRRDSSLTCDPSPVIALVICGFGDETYCRTRFLTELVLSLRPSANRTTPYSFIAKIIEVWWSYSMFKMLYLDSGDVNWIFVT